jgi:hypothetical protein
MTTRSSLAAALALALPARRRRPLELSPRRGDAGHHRRRLARAAPGAPGGVRRAPRPPALDRRAEGLLLPGGLAVRGRSQRHRRGRRLARIAEFVYRNLAAITDVTTTMDTHFAFQIFSPSFWLDRDGAPLTAHRTVTSEQIGKGDVRPNPAIAKWLCGGNYGVADQAGAPLLRGARARRQVPAVPVAAALPARLRRSRAGRRGPRGAPVPRVRARRAVVGRGQGRQPAHRELLGPAPRGAGRASTARRWPSATPAS